MYHICDTFFVRDDNMKDVVLHVRVNSDIKLQAEEILADLGINMSVAINMFLKRVCIDDYNEETKKAIEEAYSIGEDDVRYQTSEEFFKDVETWKD